MYVVAVNPHNGTVTLGMRDDLLSTGCTLMEMNWLKKPVSIPAKVLVQTRYRRKAVPAILLYRGNSLHVEFEKPEEAVAPGQVCAVYLNTCLIGGGIISSTEQRDWKSND